MWPGTEHAGTYVPLRIHRRSGADRRWPPGWFADSPATASAPTPNRGRMPRLAVIDAAAVDGRRRLVLVRRDNIEHLLMIGGPTDIVVEPNIVRAMPRAIRCRRGRPCGTEQPPRIAPLPDAGWSDEPKATASRWLRSSPNRKCRSRRRGRRGPPSPTKSAARRAAAPERRSDPLCGLCTGAARRPDRAAGPNCATSRCQPTPRAPTPRSEPIMPRPPRRAKRRRRRRFARRTRRCAATAAALRHSAAAAPSSADQNLAEMAQRLEAALRRPADRRATGRRAAGGARTAAGPQPAPQRTSRHRPAAARSAEERL